MSNYDSQSYRTAPLIADAVSRRQIIVCSAIGIGSVGVAAASTGTQEASDRTATSKEITAAKAIHQEENFKASAARIYEALLNAKQFSTFSGGRPAEIDREVGGAFSLFGGHIVGRNLDLVPNRRIVQAWRAVAWPEGEYSIAKFDLRGDDSECRVIFDHTGFPSQLAEHLESGWRTNYWKPLRKYLG
jgi:activator of HSP90 ATPase